MNREEAVKVIENMTFMCDDTDYDVMSDAVSMAIEALKYLEKNEKWIDLLNIFAESCDFDVNKIMWNAQEWIPCSERLPEENVVVLTQAKFKDDIKMAVSARQDYNYWTGWGTREVNIVAWMPLPEPYKVESEDKE